MINKRFAHLPAAFPPQCLMPLYAANGCNILTADGLGNMKEGFHKLQERMTKFGATQCGYCTPGYAMSIYR